MSHRAGLRSGKAFHCLLVTALVIFTFSPFAHAQTYTVLHHFTGGPDGASPQGTLAMDAAGNLYGTTQNGGDQDLGTVFQLKRAGSGWVLNTLHSFAGGDDGANPRGSVLVAPDGNLYGTTYHGGGVANGGTVFQLRPHSTVPIAPLQPWTETVLFRFTTESTGLNPVGSLTLDSLGNLYGVTYYGGYGIVWELQKTASGWTEIVLYAPAYGSGGSPSGGVTFDQHGNLLTTFSVGGSMGYGTIAEITPSGNGWTGGDIYDFHGTDGSDPWSQLILDPSGSLVGNTSSGGRDFLGTTFKLTPDGGGWDFILISSTFGSYDRVSGTLSDTLYATTYYAATNPNGEIYKLTRSGSGWNLTILHDFDGADGANPWAGVTADRSGNFFGTAINGGAYDRGVLWEIAP